MRAILKKNLLWSHLLLAGFCLLPNLPAKAATLDNSLITPEVINEIKAFLETDIVRFSALNQNEKYKNMKEADIIALDKVWRAENKADDKPLISSTLSNPLSSYLTRVQAHSQGLYSEIFVMDNKGLNIGQSNITSDYWQGDEGKFQKTYPKGPGTIFIDEAELNTDRHTWNAQVNITIDSADKSTALGAATVEVNLTELQRRKAKISAYSSPAPTN